LCVRAVGLKAPPCLGLRRRRVKLLFRYHREAACVLHTSDAPEAARQSTPVDEPQVWVALRQRHFTSAVRPPSHGVRRERERGARGGVGDTMGGPRRHVQ
jgi:hypothetical protein